MQEINLFSEDTTLIKCRLPDGNTIEVDAFDIDEMIAEVYSENQSNELKMATLLGDMCTKFKDRFDISISKMSMDVLIKTKTDILNNVKKNSFLGQEQPSSTVSNQGQREMSKSSD